MNYLLHLLILLAIYSIVAVSLNLVVGYCGQLNLAHAAFFAVGAYVYAIGNASFGMSFVPAAFIAVAIAAVLSLLLSVASWRLEGDFFVLASLAVHSLLYSIIHNWSSADTPVGTWGNLTNGPLGIAGISKPVVFGIEVRTLTAMAVVSTLLAAACGLLLWLLVSSPWGRMLRAMRDDELALRGLGKHTQRAKGQAFAVSCGLVSLGGVLYAGYMSYIDPSIASLDASILMLSMLLVGGSGNCVGPLIGALVLLAIPKALRFSQIPDPVAASSRLAIYGVLLVAMMRARPQGIAGEYRVE